MSNNIKEIVYSKYVIDDKFKIIEVDDRFEELTGYTKEFVKNNDVYQNDLILDSDKDEYFKLAIDRMTKNKECYIEHKIKTKDGKEILVFCFGSEQHDDNGNVYHIIRVIDMSNSLIVLNQNNVIEKKYSKKIEKLKQKNTIDSLTGVLRRSEFINKVDEFMKQSNKKPYSFVMIDVDNFKIINDTFGHLVGDFVLKSMCDVLKKIVNDKGLVARIGGDEFLILIYETKEKEDLEKLLNQIKEEVSSIKIQENIDYKPTISLGAVYDDSFVYNTFNDLYEKADELLYVSKNNNKNTFTIE